MARKEKDFSVTTSSEIKTGGGQLLRFDCRPEDVERVKRCLGSLVEGITLPQTVHVKGVSQGGYGRYSRFDIKQHDYAGGGYPGCGGFIETDHDGIMME